MLFDKKKGPPDRISDSCSLRYPELLCVASFTCLREYIRTASYCAERS